ncbi:hypothetical protein GCM10009796_12160 [Microbacterium koreense]
MLVSGGVWCQSRGMSNARRFLAGYLDAWRTNDPDTIRGLFTEDAVYLAGAYQPDPARGIDDIIALWGEEADAPDEWSFDGEVELETADAAVIRGMTTYSRGPKAGVYDNLWLLRFAADGRASRFHDWWVQRRS